MRGRTIIISLAAILSVVLVSSMVFASGVLNASNMSLFYTPVTPDAAGGTVFMDPARISKDYVNDPGYQINDVFPVHVNITGVTTGIYTYAINLTWNPAILNFSALVSYGDFLWQTDTPEPDKTSRIEPTYFVNYAAGTASIAETILGNDPDGVTGQGRLFTINFEIVGYGWSNLIIEDGTGLLLPTQLLDTTEPVPVSLAFDTADGWFDNRIRGDSDGNGVVSVSDAGVVSGNWGSTTAPFCDWDFSGVISVADAGIVSANWGRSKP